MRRAAPIAIAAVLSVVIVVAIAAGCSDDEPPPVTPLRDISSSGNRYPTTTPHQSGVAVGESLLTADISEGCGDCHADVVESYRENGMHDALMLPSGRGSIEYELIGQEVVDPDTGITGRFDIGAGGYEQQLLFRDPDGTVRASWSMPIDLIIGSGTSGRGYLAARDGDLYVHPLAWYRELDGLALSPGPGFATHATRTATHLCVGCHTGVARPRDTRIDVGFAGDISLGIACSRCHGDGETHTLDGDPRSIVNPSRLAVERQSELCYQCHFSGGTQLLKPGKAMADYVPGTPLGLVQSVFVAKEPKRDSGARVASHVARMLRSRCFTQSDGMTCTTCHNPHRKVGTSGDASGCAVCHQTDDCGEAHGARGDRTCVDCHMANVPSSDIRHTTTTDHWIRKRPELAAALQVSPEEASIGALAIADEDIVDVLDPEGALPDATLMRVDAYLRGVDVAAEVFNRDAPAYLQRARTLLNELQSEDPSNVEVLWRQARVRRFGHDNPSALRYATAAAERDPSHPRVLLEMALASFGMYSAGDLGKALPAVARARRAMPDDLTLAHAEAMILEHKKRPREAVAVLEQIRDRRGPRSDLAEFGVLMAERSGINDVALTFALDALLFAPRDPDLLARASRLSLAENWNPKTVTHLANMALEQDANHLGALLALANAYLNTGDDENARQTARRAADAHPRHPAVEALLRRLR